MENQESSLSQPGALGEPRQDLFIGKNGLRAGWRLFLYVLIVVVSALGINALVRMVFHPQHVGLNGWVLLWEELSEFVLVFGAAWIMSRIERRPVGTYGLPAKEMFASKFWLGFLFGLLEISVLIGLISVFEGYSFGTLALRGSEIIKSGLLYLVGFTFVGLFEEFLFRGYTQYTLSEGIGFWPAALVLSFLFGGAHLMNPGEG